MMPRRPPIPLLTPYIHWLHTQWPAGTVEALPTVNPDGSCNLHGVRLVGDITGIPLLKFAIDSGAKAVRGILGEADFHPGAKGMLDLAIVGGGVAGIAAAVEAKAAGLRCAVYEASTPFHTVANFPVGKPIYTYPRALTPAGELQIQGDTRETLLAELEAQRQAAGVETITQRISHVGRQGATPCLVPESGPPIPAQRIIIAIGRSGDHRTLGVEGEDLGKVSNRLHDPGSFGGQRVVVVGGGDAAVEAAIALATAGAETTLVHRGPSLSRPKPGNIDRLAEISDHPPTEGQGSLQVRLHSQISRIGREEVELRTSDGREECIANEAVFLMIGREAPLAFFRRSGIPIQGELGAKQWTSFGLFLAFCLWLYHWKSYSWFALDALNPAGWLTAPALARDLADVVAISAQGPSFHYTLAYSVLIGVFGLRRMRRRRTPYIKLQTWTLMLVQWLPLFLLPELLLPWMGVHGAFEAGLGQQVADAFFPTCGYGHGREYWRSYGLILAWPLFVYNWFTTQPMVPWLVLGSLQTFVLVPWMVWRWGKGAYCGWICSCGALAETLGDTHRHKMPHGPLWNRMNLVGQVILFAAFAMMALRTWGWTHPGGAIDVHFQGWLLAASPLTYKWIVDVMLAGVLGVGAYFWFSGRVWCRFACPLAALMHIYARFSRFRIFPEKDKCISCNVCTATCHQGIDVMSFANKGMPMEDPQCVRCSACVEACPTGTLAFGHFDASGQIVIESLSASPVRAAEGLPG
jgi:thioredoxin reductase/Pyruvate/2-oxoacid:ferredoxin oxidoreductase delta subunit